MAKRRDSSITKKYILKHPVCEFCGKQAEEVHHIKPLVVGGTHEEENLISLCKHCHSVMHKRIAPSGELISIGRQKAKENPQPKTEPKKKEHKITEEEVRINKFLGRCAMYAMQLYEDLWEKEKWDELNCTFHNTSDNPPNESELFILLEKRWHGVHAEVKAFHNNTIWYYGCEYTPKQLHADYITIDEITGHPKYRENIKEYYKELGLHTERKQVAK